MLEYIVVAVCFFSLVIVFSAKNVLLKSTLIIIFYPLVILTFLYFGMSASRIMLGYFELYQVNIFSSIILLFFMMVSIYTLCYKEAKRKAHIVTYSESNSLLYFMLCMLIVLLVCAFPSAFFLSENRFGFGGGAALVITSYILLSVNDNRTVLFIFRILLFYMMARGERVEFILPFVFSFIIPKLDTFKVNFRIVLVIGLVACVGLFGGVIRSNGSLANNSMLDLLILGTTVDVIHVYLTSFYTFSSGMSESTFFYNDILSVFGLHGLLLSLYDLPSMQGYFDQKSFSNKGGGLILSSSVLAFGYAGGVLFAVLYAFFVKLMLRASSVKFFSIVSCVFFMSQLRLSWYGFYYWSSRELFALLFVFVLIFIKSYWSKSRNYVV